jgi:4-amino-4-deoxy-L-arabinose transferase-like glycosyltransferase
LEWDFLFKKFKMQFFKKIKQHIHYRSIIFWIIMFGLLRLYGIAEPPLETAHNWRQTNVAMVARNFLEVDNNIFFPRIDIAGEKSGITGMEFPLFNYLIYLLSLVFGYQHWWGRLINLLVTSTGVFYFYKIVRDYFSPRVAFNAAFILLVSLWFAYARKVMPDTFSMSLVMIGSWYGLKYLEQARGFKNLLLYAILMLAGILSKLPSGYVLVIFAPLLFCRDIAVRRKIIFVSLSAMLVFLTALYYFGWTPYLVERYGFWYYYMGKPFGQGAREIWENLPQTLARFYETALHYIGFAFFVAGIAIAVLRSNKRLLVVLVLTFVAFAVFIIRAGFAFPHHSYYIVPFVPVMALVAGYGVSIINNRKWMAIALALIAIEGILNQQHDFRIGKKEAALLHLEAKLDSISQRGDLIVINSGIQPTPMYFAHRRGWLTDNQNLMQPSFIDSLQQLGLQYIVVIRHTFGTDVELDYPLAFQDDDFRIYQPGTKVINNK